MTAEQARQKAAALMAGIKAGEEPGDWNGSASAKDPTLAEASERYLREHVAVHCKPTTARDAKTGARAVTLSPAAREVLPHLPRLPENPWVITGQGMWALT